MKKLSLLLLTLCVSLAGWANESDPYRLNPFAYDLSSSWDEASQKLTLRFKVNSVPNLENKNGWACGIQVFAVDSRETKYYIWGTPGDTIRKAHNGGAGTYEYVADLSSGRDLHGNLIPRNEDLTWMVRVAGRGNGNSTPVTPGNGEAAIDYTLPRFWNFQNSFSDKRYISPSIAVNTSPETPNFGDIYIIDNMNPSSHTSSKWSALSTGRGIYVYKPDFKTKAYSGKKVAIDPATKTGGFVDTSEPRDLCVSKDGRVFVCSYSTASTVAVWELKNNYTTWTPILNKEDITKKVTGGTSNKHSVVSIDVKGEGDNVTLLLLCKGSVNNNNHSNFPLLKCVEYNVSTETLTEIQLPQQIYDFVYYNDGINAHARISYDDTNNWIWCGFGTNGGASYVRAFDPTIANDNNNVNKNLKVNETIGNFWGGEAFCVKGNMLIKSIQFDTYNRPSIIFRTIDRSKTDVTAVITDDPCFTYNGDVQNSTLDADFATDCYNDFALDYVNNLYVANNWSGQVFPISLPYDGIKDTPAPSNQKFRLPLAVPNILATDLRFAPDGNSDRYVFSFNVNTTPQVAQIRFYKSYGDNGENDMKKNLAKINADDYQGGNAITPSFVYDIPTDQLKQGKISVSLGMCGGIIEGGKITNGKLPRGEWYWSVYVEAPRKSSVFAPIYRLIGQTHASEGYERKHATVNNYPETDGFGNIIVAHNPQNTTNDATRPEKGLRIYGISDSGNDEHAYTNTDRYSLRAEYLNKNATGMLNYPRRMDVASDGKVYIADEGSPTDDKDWKNVDNGAVTHVRGGVKVWDPAAPNKFTQFSDNKIFTATGVALWDGKLYATNTYDEYVKHLNGKINYTKEQQANTSQYGWNGFVGYVLNKYKSPGNWNSWSGNKTDYALGRGDASGNIAIVAMDKGVWMCQHKEHNRAVKDATLQPLADNLDGYLLSFVPYGSNTRTWRSCIENGVDDYDSSTNRKERADASDFSQKKTSPVQSTPGGGIAYKKVNGKEYLYVVNHDGNIAQLEITSWSGSGTTATPTIPIENIKILTTPAATKSTKVASAGGRTANWTAAFITSMTFDYAGNLVTTTGKNYHDGPQDIIVYTMPYDRVNAREIQAPNSCRYIPERVSHMDMGNQELANIINYYLENNSECYVDIFRPMFNTAFNTICLPFDVDLRQATAGAYHNATLMQFDKAEVTEVNNEKMLELQFTEKKDKIIEAGIPYLIKPENPIPGIMSLEQGINFKTINSIDQTRTFNNGDNSITFIGIIPYQFINVINQPLPLIVVDQNRLAEVSNGGNILGFRAYFQLEKELAPGTKVGISARKPTPTNVITIDGKRVNIEKFLREGRVYIRVGDSLYTITGEKVE